MELEVQTGRGTESRIPSDEAPNVGGEQSCATDFPIRSVALPNRPQSLGGMAKISEEVVRLEGLLGTVTAIDGDPTQRWDWFSRDDFGFQYQLDRVKFAIRFLSSRRAFARWSLASTSPSWMWMPGDQAEQLFNLSADHLRPCSHFLARWGTTDSVFELATASKAANHYLHSLSDLLGAFKQGFEFGYVSAAIVDLVQASVVAARSAARYLRLRLSKSISALRAVAFRRHFCVDESDWFFTHGCHPPDAGPSGSTSRHGGLVGAIA